MGDRPNIHAENLRSAARRYGDAMLAHTKATRTFYRGGANRDELLSSVAACEEAERDLHSAAKAYATRMRRKLPPPPSGDSGA